VVCCAGTDCATASLPTGTLTRAQRLCLAAGDRAWTVRSRLRSRTQKKGCRHKCRTLSPYVVAWRLAAFGSSETRRVVRLPSWFINSGARTTDSSSASTSPHNWSY